MNKLSSSCLVVTGEKSGEEHFMSFYPELKQLVPKCDFFGVGGDLLRNNGVETIYTIEQFEAIGFGLDVLKKIPFFKKSMQHLIDECDRRGAKNAILVDFQGFNLSLAKKLKERGINVFYYVAPQAWAWKEWRAKNIKQYVHTLFSILPFEKEWFGKRGVSNIIGVEHPVYKQYAKHLESFDRKPEKAIERILILPGSRNSEASKTLPVFKEVCETLKKKYPDIMFSLVQSESVSTNLYQLYPISNCRYFTSAQLVEAMKSTDMAIAASGTVTLSTALFQLPTIVCYKLGLFNKFVMENIVRYKGFASLTNIIFNKEVLPEFLQDEMQSQLIVEKVISYIESEMHRKKTIVELKKLKTMLSGDDIDIAKYIAGQMGEKNYEN